jgi:hypothetical protein
MRAFLCRFAALVVLLAQFSPAVSAAAAPTSKDEFKQQTSAGLVAAEKLTQITGIAISPLAGVGGVGAYRYWKATPEQRPGLSWYAQPWFFLPALLVVGVCVAKDAAGPVVPTSLKKPLDLIELFENKASGIIAIGAVVPMALEIFEAVKPSSPSAGLGLAGAHFAALDFSWLGDLFMVPLALLVYGVVWLFSHTINVLILVSPFTTVDTALKSLRGAVLGSVVGLPAISDKAGAVWAGIIVLVSLLVAPWAFRTTVFGSIFAWDIVSRRKHWWTPKADCVWAFSACKVGKAPHRAFGRVARNERGELTFTWRPWLVFAPRTEVLPAGNYVIGRGLVHSEILRVEGDSAPDIFNLPPRCNGHEDAVAAAIGLKEVRPVGLRAFWAALKGLFTGQPATA